MRPAASTFVCVVFLLITSANLFAQTQPATRSVNGWILPAGDAQTPIYGIDGGLSIGLHPTRGPRGLIRIYAPYLGQPLGRVINFIAIEPIVAGKRSLSEIENSATDGKSGKVIRIDGKPRMQRTSDGAASMRIRLQIERLGNGAEPIVEAIFRQDRPHEVRFEVLAAPSSAKMDACILSATMGNYARLRRLKLKDSVVDAASLWPGFDVRAKGFEGFSAHRQWPIEKLVVRDGEAVVSATSDEADPTTADYSEEVARHWRYVGKAATQTWRAAAEQRLIARVNGRCVYWNSRAPIPGGVAFENFELEAPFVPGQAFTFEVEAAK